MQLDDFKDCMAWWGKREENDQAWKIPVKELLETNCNLDRKNPRGGIDFEHLPPDQLADQQAAARCRLLAHFSSVAAGADDVSSLG